MDTPGGWVGRRVPKTDAPRKVSGDTHYLQDLVLPGMAVGRMLWSEHPHARILSIDTSAARALPGVLAVLTAADLPPQRLGMLKDNPPLKGDKVRSTRDEVAAVAAIDEQTAQEALDLIDVRYEALPPLFDVAAAAAEGAPAIHEGTPHNVVRLRYDLHYGDVEAAAAASDVIVEGRFELPRTSHGCLGPSAAAASWDRSGNLTFYSATQVPFLHQRELAELLGIPGDKVRVIQPDIGGAFGSKLDLSPFEVVCCHLARAAGRPVRINFTREEELRCSPTRQAAILDCRAGATAQGDLTFRDVRVTLDNGAYVSWGATIPSVLMMAVTSLYRCPNVRLRTHTVYTNNPYAGSMRGYGNPQGTFAIEGLMDMLAQELGMDRLELRLRNCHGPGEVTPQGLAITSWAQARCLQQAAQRLGWGQPLQASAPAAGIADPTTGIRLRRGRGIASYFHVGGGARVYRSDGCGAVVRLDDHGGVTLITGSTEIGQGSETVLAQIVAHELDLPLDRIRVINSDTAVKPWDVGVHASRTTFIAGNAALRAARQVRAALLVEAGTVLGCVPSELDLRGGMVCCSVHPQRSVAYDKVVRAAHFRPGGTTLAAEVFYDPATERQDGEYRGNLSATYSSGAQAAEVEVDLDTGKVRVCRLVVAQDVGKAINPLLVEGQIEGGAVMGLGYALHEELTVRHGTIASATLLEFRMPRAEDVPPIDVILVETDEGTGPFGAKGVGEGGIIPTAAAIANAVADAIGVRVWEVPLLPQRVLAALQGRPQG